MAESAIRFTGVNKWYGKLHVLREINLAIGAGEVVVVCGPSGSGKSTLIRTVNGLERVQSGDVVVLGESIARRGVNLPALRTRVGMVFQSFNLFPHMTALENIMLAPMKVKKVPRAEAEKAARCSSAWACARRPATTRPTSRAASSSAWPSRARWPCSRRSCCSTSRPPRSTPR
jgi:ABC-type polar amino acid transport system ATPase subunit